jgi:hypothetical protein
MSKLVALMKRNKVVTAIVVGGAVLYWWARTRQPVATGVSPPVVPTGIPPPGATSLVPRSGKNLRLRQ